MYPSKQVLGVAATSFARFSVPGNPRGVTLKIVVK
jgi:hypothetical protein